MTSHSRTDVLICGAGACGLTLAVELARRGITFRLIEKMPAPFAGSRGKGIQPRTQEVFEDMGILDRVVAAGGLYALYGIWIGTAVSAAIAGAIMAFIHLPKGDREAAKAGQTMPCRGQNTGR